MLTGITCFYRIHEKSTLCFFVYKPGTAAAIISARDMSTQERRAYGHKESQ